MKTVMIYDVIIIGAGPAGSTAAIYLGKSGKKVLLLDKAEFPRDKVCGDALAGRTIDVLQELELLEEIDKGSYCKIKRLKFSSANHSQAEIKIAESSDSFWGYIYPRLEFDLFLFEEAKKYVLAKTKHQVKNIISENGMIKGVKALNEGDEEVEYRSKVVIGADGFQSLIARKLSINVDKMKDTAVATRAYYKNVRCDLDSVEVHYLVETLPGFLWIFPVNDELVNVGIGFDKEGLKKSKRRIIDIHEDAIASDFLKERFQNAELVGKVQGWTLPLGSKKRKISGNGFVLIGDAAGLVDPFTGDGIGNAMFSGKIAAESINSLLEQKSEMRESDLKQYETRLWKEIAKSLELNTKVQKFLKYPFLLNFITKQAQKKAVQAWINGLISGEISRKEIFSPFNYLKMIFAK